MHVRMHVCMHACMYLGLVTRDGSVARRKRRSDRRIRLEEAHVVEACSSRARALEREGAGHRELVQLRVVHADVVVQHARRRRDQAFRAGRLAELHLEVGGRR